MTNVVITGHTSFCNRGNEALVRSTIDTLASRIPNARFAVFSLKPELDRERYNGNTGDVRFLQLNYNPAVYGKKGKAWYLLVNKLGIDVRSWLRVDDPSYQAIKNCDLLVVSGGDLLSGYGLNNLKRHTHLALGATALKKPVVVFAHSFNPFETEEELQYARFFLSKVTLLTVRERLSAQYLREIKVKAPIQLAADPAFLLKPAPADRINGIMSVEGIPADQPLVGISASAGMAWYTKRDFAEYTSVLAAGADHLVSRHGMSVIFVPHVIGPNELGGDDRQASEAIIAKMNHKNKAYPIRGEYSCSELKGVIGHCRLFIGSRTHSTIASTSMLVPTLALAYSIKAYGIVGDLIKSRDMVCDVLSVTAEELIDRANDLINNRDAVAQELEKKIRVERERAWITPQLCADLVR